MIYTNPTFQEIDRTLDTIERLAQHDRIRYIKDASSNAGQLLSIIGRCQGKSEVLAASSHISAAVLLLGGRGWTAGPACLVTEKCVELYQHSKNRDWESALSLQKNCGH